MMTIFHKLNDDRGIRCKKICSVSSAIKKSGDAKRNLIHKDESGRFWSTFLFTGFIFATILHFWFWYMLAEGWGSFFTPSLIGLFVFSFVGFGGSMGVVAKLFGWRSPKHARQAMLRAKLCPSCGYSIAELIPESDGCAVCPECGAAWGFDG